MHAGASLPWNGGSCSRAPSGGQMLSTLPRRWRLGAEVEWSWFTFCYSYFQDRSLEPVTMATTLRLNAFPQCNALRQRHWYHHHTWQAITLALSLALFKLFMLNRTLPPHCPPLYWLWIQHTDAKPLSANQHHLTLDPVDFMAMLESPSSLTVFSLVMGLSLWTLSSPAGLCPLIPGWWRKEEEKN